MVLQAGQEGTTHPGEVTPRLGRARQPHRPTQASGRPGTAGPSEELARTSSCACQCSGRGFASELNVEWVKGLCK